MNEDQKDKNYYFTFGYGQNPGVGKYVKFYGTYDSARDQMVQRFGAKWAFQYSEERFLPLKEKFNLTEYTS